MGFISALLMTDQNESMDVRYVANLARLNLTEAEADQFQGQLVQILDYVKQLDELDVEGVEPMAHAIRVENVYREDVVVPSMDHDDFIANAPAAINNLVRVPNIIE